MKKIMFILIFCMVFVCSLEAQLTSLQERARALLNKRGSTSVGNVNLDSLKQNVLPALQNSGATSTIANTAAKYLGGSGTSGLSNSLTQSLQDAQSIYSSSVQLMNITNRIQQGGGASAVTTSDISDIINASSSIYNSSSRLVELVKSNAQMINGLMGAYNKLNPGSSGSSIIPSGSSDTVDKMQMLQKLLPYLKK
ncbi:hypothetical protein KAJ27_07920 [bacterium]|nr:hypothetical protein [bacterium]